MMERKIELIEKYLLDEMSVKEQVGFEELLRKDPELMREYLLRREINNAIQEEEVLSLRDSLDKIVNEESGTTIKSRKLVIYTSVAAIAILLIIVTSINLLPLKNQNKSDIFQSYYCSYPSVSSFRSDVEQNEVERILHEAFDNYDKGNFMIASELFSKVNRLEGRNYISEFYFSICEIENSNFQNAKDHFTNLVLDENHIFLEQANWYLALVLIKQNKFNEAEKVLLNIVNDNMANKLDAEEILKTLVSP